MLPEILEHRPARPLTKARERELARAWQENGDQNALMRLIGAHVWLVRYVMRRVPVGDIPRDDLLQEGIIGLIEAAQRFDSDKDLRFSTYARHRVRARLQEYILRNRSLVRLPLDGESKALLFGHARHRRDDGVAPGERRGPPERIGKRSLASQQLLRRRMDLADRSLNIPAAEGSKEQLIDLLAAPERVPEEELDRRTIGALVRNQIRRLPERERYILEQRLLTDEAPSRAAIGEQLAISRERVRQLENRALRQVLTEVSRQLGGELSVDAIVDLFRETEDRPDEAAMAGAGP